MVEPCLQNVRALPAEQRDKAPQRRRRRQAALHAEAMNRHAGRLHVGAVGPFVLQRDDGVVDPLIAVMDQTLEHAFGPATAKPVIR